MAQNKSYVFVKMFLSEVLWNLFLSKETKCPVFEIRFKKPPYTVDFLSVENKEKNQEKTLITLKSWHELCCLITYATFCTLSC